MAARVRACVLVRLGSLGQTAPDVPRRKVNCQQRGIAITKTTLAVILLAGYLLTACGPAAQGYGRQRYWPSNPQAGGFQSNGQRIYFTATDESGRSVFYTGGPRFGGMMMGGNLTCASCHGADGRGGVQYVHMESVDAPPIYYDALLEMLQEESSRTPAPSAYTVDDLRRAVVEGRHPDGDALGEDMPRWRLSADDLADLLEYLKTLP